MNMASRRNAAQPGLWNLFAWLGHSCDQAAGIFLSPLVIVVYARSIERDIVQLSLIVSGFGLAWVAGAAIGPLLQRMTSRVMPWIVGGYIVRTSAIVLLAYSAADRGSPSEQRFRSALICITAYAAATGIARSAEARKMLSFPAREAFHVRSVAGSTGTVVILLCGAWAMWSVLSTDSLAWSRAFGRVWSLSAVALGVATLAAIKQGSGAVDIPLARLQPSSMTPAPHIKKSGVLAIAVGLAIIVLGEVASLLALFEDFRRDSIVIRSSLALFAMGWIIGHIGVGLASKRFASGIVLQVSIGLGALGMIAALALQDVSRADWFPETVGDYRTLSIVVFAIAASFGAAAAARRHTMSLIVSRSFTEQSALTIVCGLAAGAAPVIVALIGRETSVEWILIVGIVASLLTLVLAGILDPSSASRRPSLRQDQLSPALMSRR